MNNELKQIKKIYGEDTMHLCRNLFPSILEHEGLLLSILKEHFAPTKFLAQEIISQHQEENFKNFIFGFIDVENDIITTNKTPYELMKLAGYTLYECHTEEEIQDMLTAKKMEGRIMQVVPFLLVLYLQSSSPGFFNPLYHNIMGYGVMTAMLALYIAATLWSRRIMDIRV